MSTQVQHAEPGFFQKYLWSTDHKMIAMQYLFTGMAMAMIGGYLRIRLPHAAGFSQSICSRLRNRHAGQVQRAGHHARQHHDFLGGHAGAHRRIRKFPDSADDRLRRHGVSANQSPVVSDFPVERARSSLLLFWSRAAPFGGAWTAYPPLSASGAYNLTPIGRHAVAARRGPGIRRVSAGRHQLHRHHDEQPRAGHENVRHPDRGLDDRPGQRHFHGVRRAR